VGVALEGGGARQGGVGGALEEGGGGGAPWREFFLKGGAQTPLFC
jgi:hypothetical protein